MVSPGSALMVNGESKTIDEVIMQANRRLVGK